MNIRPLIIIFLMVSQFNLLASDFFIFPEGLSEGEKEMVIEHCSGFIPAFCHGSSMIDDAICDLPQETQLMDECMMDVLRTISDTLHSMDEFPY